MVKAIKETKAEKKDREKLPAHKVLASEMARLASRVSKLNARVQKWGSPMTKKIEGLLEDAVSCFTATEKELVALPNDFRPSRISKKLEAGAVVQIREKRRAEYDGLLKATELMQLKVVALGPKKVAVTTADGTRMFLPRGHLQVQPQA